MEFLTTEQAANYLSEICPVITTSRRTLEDWRCKLKGPDYWRVGAGVMYRKDDLDAWVELAIVKVSATTGMP